MKRLVLRRALAVLLMLAGAGGLFTVAWLLPWLVREWDPEWLEQHSEQAQWEATQQRIRIAGWNHDDPGPVGANGGKEWAEWIIAILQHETDADGCAGGHKVSALNQITNFSTRTEDSLPYGNWKDELSLWLEWWERNRHKTQEEWMVDGFAAVGVTIHNPLKKEDWPKLLKLLAHKNPETKGGESQPGRHQPQYLYRNAVRCLRDSGFDPVTFALEEEISPELKAGLLFYRDRLMGTDNWWGRRPGRLFGKQDGWRTNYRFGSSRFLDPAFRWGWGVAAVVVFMAGIWLWTKPPRWVRALRKGALPGA